MSTCPKILWFPLSYKPAPYCQCVYPFDASEILPKIVPFSQLEYSERVISSKSLRDQYQAASSTSRPRFFSESMSRIELFNVAIATRSETVTLLCSSLIDPFSLEWLSYGLYPFINVPSFRWHLLKWPYFPHWLHSERRIIIPLSFWASFLKALLLLLLFEYLCIYINALTALVNTELVLFRLIWEILSNCFTTAETTLHYTACKNWLFISLLPISRSFGVVAASTVTRRVSDNRALQAVTETLYIQAALLSARYSKTWSQQLYSGSQILSLFWLPVSCS